MIDTRTLPTLDPAQRSWIRSTAVQVEQLDGAEPLNEATLLRLTRAMDPFRHLLATDGGSRLGYAQLDLGDPRVPTAELLVGPDRRAEVAGALLVAAEAGGARPLLVWSRGRSPIGVVALERGYSEQRVMLIMDRALTGAADSPVEAPAGIRIRPFQVGADEAGWLAVNARAFADHPEQGSWTRADLDERMAQGWFDPAGFLLAEDETGQLLGYHWTKLHPRADGETVAEVYVLGIDPAGQGKGLGRALLTAGLRYLASTPARRVMLYLEAENTAALSLYTATGFSVVRRDTRWRGPDSER